MADHLSMKAWRTRNTGHLKAVLRQQRRRCGEVPGGLVVGVHRAVGGGAGAAWSKGYSAGLLSNSLSVDHTGKVGIADR